MRVPGAPEILPERIIEIARSISRKHIEKREASVHHGRHHDEKDSGKHS